MAQAMLVAVVIIAVATLIAAQTTDPIEDALFEMYLIKYGKTFRNQADRQSARRNFATFAAYIRDHRKRQQIGGKDKPSFSVDFNELSVMTEEELKHLTGTKVPEGYRKIVPDPSVASVAKQTETNSVDWTPLFGPVKNQESCGSCWAFAAMGVYEALVKQSTGVSVVLSEQMLVDCDNVFDAGCEGGWPIAAWYWYTSRHHPMSDSDYPYTGNQTECKYQPTNTLPYLTTPGNGIPAHEDYLIEALAKGPVTVALYANLTSFFSYGKEEVGVYYDPACATSDLQLHPNHAVVLVGYGVDDETKVRYWKIRNSWGSSWGDDGYMRIQRGDNHCGIEDNGQQVSLA